MICMDVYYNECTGMCEWQASVKAFVKGVHSVINQFVCYT